MTIDDMIDDLLEKEGGYVNHPADKGGPTKYGITLDALEAWRDKRLTAEDVKKLDKTEAIAIYKHDYYRVPKIDMLPAPLQPIVFDMAVNMGPAAAIKLLQEVIKRLSGSLAVDGKIGPKTMALCLAAYEVHKDEVINQLVERRIEFYERLVEERPSQEVFLNGWTNRARSFLV
jgi:lysozyme family protein